MADRAGAVNCGGIGAMHLMVQNLGLVDDIDRHLELLKVHLRYHESDHEWSGRLRLAAGRRRGGLACVRKPRIRREAGWIALSRT